MTQHQIIAGQKGLVTIEFSSRQIEREMPMRLQTRFAMLLRLIAFCCFVSSGATITGTVKGTEGAPF